MGSKVIDGHQLLNENFNITNSQKVFQTILTKKEAAIMLKPFKITVINNLITVANKTRLLLRKLKCAVANKGFWAAIAPNSDIWQLPTFVL